jgi:glycosyltransferase involved in cell wall biosynthesis
VRIALVIENSIHSHGGVEILTRELIRGLAGSCNVFLASPDDEGTLSADMSLTNELCGHFRIDPSKTGWRSDLAVWMGAQSIDLWHLQSGGTYAWGSGGWGPSLVGELSLSGIHCINTNHQAVSPWDADFRGHSFARRFAGFLNRWPSKARHLMMTEREVMVSDHDLRIASRCYPFQAHKMLRIYHSRIDPLALPSLNDVTDNSHKIISLATITPRKGQAVLLNAFCRAARQFPGWTLHFHGMCHDQDYLESMVQTAALSGLSHRVRFEGPTNDHLGVLAGAGIYVQPSYLEALGLSLQEALSLGRPCIGSRVGGIPELIEHGIDGLLFSPGNVSELAEALSILMSDEWVRGRLGTAGRLKISRLGMNRDQMAASYLDLYRQTIQSPTKTR